MKFNIINRIIGAITSTVLFIVFGTIFISLQKEVGVGSVTNQITWIIFIAVASLKLGHTGLDI